MPNIKNKTKFNSSSIPKNLGWLEKYGDGGETDQNPLLKSKTLLLEGNDENPQDLGPDANRSGFGINDKKIHISDNRKIRATTGKKINPNVALKTGDYDENVIDSLIKYSIKYNIDPNRVLAQGLAESTFGKKDSQNIGHLKHFYKNESPYPQMMEAILEGDRLAKTNKNKKTTREEIIQGYNGYGKLFPETEKDYHGGNSKAFYEVPFGKEGYLDMDKNPLYGIEIKDLMDNVIGKDAQIQYKILKSKNPIKKEFYNPNNVKIPYRRKDFKYGGWLDTYEDGGETDPPVNLRSASTQLASPVSTQAPEVPLNKTGWDWVKQKYENRQPSEWNMLMMDKSGSYVDSGVDPFSLMLTAPQQVIKAGVKGGKALLDASKSNKIKPSTLQNVENVQKAGIPNPLKIADNIIPRTFAPGHYLGMEDSWNNYSPLNWIPGYGKKLSQNSELYSPSIMFNDKPALLDNIISAEHPVGFRKFGNSMQDVIDKKVLGPKGTGMGSKQIKGEGNWAEPGKVNEHYSGVFEATMNPNVKGSNIKLEAWNKRNGMVGTTKEGNVDIPLTDPGLSFNRRLPFSNKYVSIDKQKLIDNKFQLATQLPHVQSLIEKYGIIAGQAAVFGYLYGGKDQAIKNLKTVNKYSIDPVANWTKKQWEDLKKSDFYKESTKTLQNKQDNSQWLNKYK